MNELIRIENGEVKLDSRMIAEHFGKEHKNVLRDIQDEMEKLENAGLGNALIFEPVEYTDKKGEKRPAYEMTEEGALQLAARYDAVARRKLIIKIKELKEQNLYKLPRTYAEALRELADVSEEKERLALRIEADRPKVIFADAVSASRTSILIGELAKLLRQNGIEIGQNRLFEYLRNNGYLIKRNGTDRNLPTQRSMEMGLFEIKEHSHVDGRGNNVTTKTTKVTGKGQLYFINKFMEQAS